jgi:hypothetical protein
MKLTAGLLEDGGFKCVLFGLNRRCTCIVTGNYAIQLIN